MVSKRRAARKPRRKARKSVRKSRVPRGLLTTTQLASIKETINFKPIAGNSPYKFQFNLSQFERASNLAVNFKLYKATKVIWTIEPYFNTFTDDGTPQSIPYMFMTMNRTQDSTPLSVQDLKAMGARPQKLTSKKVISYRPNWCSPGLISAEIDENAFVRQVIQNGLKAQFSYLQTPNVIPPPGTANADFIKPNEGETLPANVDMADTMNNVVVYNGHDLWLDQALTSVGLPVAQVSCTVHWEFRDPKCTYAYVPPTVIEPLLLKTSA